MPMRERVCQKSGCPDYGVVTERYYRSSDPEEPCAGCGGVTAMVISAPAVIFAGKMTARYNDKSLEYANREGEWMHEKNAPGGPKWTYVEDWSERKRIMKQEGLEEMGRAEISSDGRSVSTRGMPGTWI